MSGLEPITRGAEPPTRDDLTPEVEVGVLSAKDEDEIVALRAIVEGTARSTGEVFFESLVRHLAPTIGVNHAFVAEFAGVATRVRTLANWGNGEILPNVEYDLAGTPCEDVVRGGLCHHPLGVHAKFPLGPDLKDLGIESYLGVPLLDGEGNVLGHLAVFDERPMPSEPRKLFIFRIFAARAAVELERLRVEKRLVESERRYRDLYEEAPNAYVAFGKDLRLRQREPPRGAASRSMPRKNWSVRPSWILRRYSRQAEYEPSKRYQAVSRGRRFPDWSWK